jgi:hypothetical protein
MHLYDLQHKERLNDFICCAFAPTAILSFNPFGFLQIMPEAHAQVNIRLDSLCLCRMSDSNQAEPTSISYQGGLGFCLGPSLLSKFTSDKLDQDVFVMLTYRMPMRQPHLCNPWLTPSQPSQPLSSRWTQPTSSSSLTCQASCVKLSEQLA